MKKIRINDQTQPYFVLHTTYDTWTELVLKQTFEILFHLNMFSRKEKTQQKSFDLSFFLSSRLMFEQFIFIS